MQEILFYHVCLSVCFIWALHCFQQAFSHIPTVSGCGIESNVRKWQSSQSRKKWQKLMQGLYQNTCISSNWENMLSFKKIGIKLYEELCSRSTHCLYTESEKWSSLQCGKSDKNNDLTIISKSHAHPHTMKITQAKFQNHLYKTVRGVALTRHLG